jgi:2,4-dienoyl-CoA reductase (NADPH2)
MIDLVSDGSSWQEIVELATRIEAAGATIINTGIGWHEARVPTIATMVPRGSYAWVTKKMKGNVSIPLCTSNRINTPEVRTREYNCHIIYVDQCVIIINDMLNLQNIWSDC